MLTFFLAVLGSLFSVVNPLGAVPVYLAMTGHMSRKERNQLSAQTALWVFLILLVFFLGGTYILSFFGISVNALRIAGGLVIINSGFGLLNGDFRSRRVNDEIEAEGVEKEDISFTPMAMPMLAGPGSISLLIGMAAENEVWPDRLIIVGAVFAMAVIILLILRYAPLLFRILGKAGVKALSRIIGFLVVGIGIEIMLRGLVSLVRSLWV
ncbi:antibiotic resistance protein MarC [Lewinellaceae bacterium SD302]|nr:antibiotic resistance protein MarC [Lewinellaceae bacterium SD302]